MRERHSSQKLGNTDIPVTKDNKSLLVDTGSLIRSIIIDVRRWLETEYNTAVKRAHLAADWRQFEREKDILPNLEWMPSTAVKPDEAHKELWGIILPIDDPFWNEYRPGDRWGCKCGLRNTDKKIKKPPKGYRKIPKPAPGLDNNPGKDAMLYSFSHPYFTAGYWAYKKLLPIAKKTVERLLIKRKIKQTITSIEKTGHAKKTAIKIGTLPKELDKFAKDNGIKLASKNVLITDNAIKHATRTLKKEKGKSLTNEEFIQLPAEISTAQVLYDEEKKNFIFVVEKKGRILKYVFEPNYLIKADGKKRREFVLVTAGVIEDYILNMKNYIKIK